MLPLGEEAEEPIGIDMERRVVEKEELWFDLSLSNSNQDSLFFGHSSKKGLSNWFSGLTGSSCLNP